MKIPSNRIDDIARWFRTQLAERYERDEIDRMAEYCLEAFAGYSRNDLLLRPESRVTESELLKLHFAVKDLKRGRPLQYILGKAWFFGLTLQVTPDVLIPRPETEELVQLIIDEQQQTTGSFSILDIGTGSGCIAVALKKKLPRCHVYALDVSHEALQIAKANAEANEAEIKFIEADILNESLHDQLPRCQVIVSNPPYVLDSEKDSMAQHVVEHEPHTALFVPDTDQLKFYRVIGKMALEKLKPGGTLYLEINEALGLETCMLMQKIGFKNVQLKKDMQGKDRMITASMNPIEG
ncbi:MAG: peptide chain release factor N(5)-glutamine methyltransferase [Bacteroidia bacterium]